MPGCRPAHPVGGAVVSRLAEEEIREHAYQARMEAIGRHLSQLNELTAQKYLLESALIWAAPEQKPALLRCLIQVAAYLTYLKGAGHAASR